MKSRIALLLVLCLALPVSVFADFQYQQTTKITGGAIIEMMKVMAVFSKQARQIGDPITSAVYVKGNRMAHVNPEFTQIIDLDKETITQIDHQKKEYSVMTFEQLKQQMQQAMEDARKRSKEQQQQPNQADQMDMNFKVNVRNTGAAKQVTGLDTKESILTMVLEGKDKQTGQTGNLNMTNDMWMAPEIRGYSEVRDFQQRLAVKMGMIFNDAIRPQMAAMQPAMLKGMGEMAKEMSKLNGVPVLQVMRMGSTANGEPLPAASEAPLPPSQPMPSAGEAAGNAAGDAAKEGTAAAVANKVHLGGLAGLGGFGHKKKKEEQQQPKDQTTDKKSQEQQQKAAAVLMESSTEITGFSSAPVDDTRFQVPAGYKQIQPDMRRGK